MMRQLKLIIAEDNGFINGALKRDLQKLADIECVTNGKDLVDRVKVTNPDVILTDISMPVMNGIDAVKRIRKDGHERIIIGVFTVHENKNTYNKLKPYINGFIGKSEYPDVVYYKVKQLIETGTCDLSDKMERILNSKAESDLTEREEQVALLICQGMDNDSIARELGIEYNTVKNHKRNIFSKLGVNDILNCVNVLRERELVLTE